VFPFVFWPHSEGHSVGLPCGLPFLSKIPYFPRVFRSEKK
jgi:hypothetical protein